METRLKSFLRNYLGYMTVALVSLIYIATAFVTVTETHKTVSQILADGILSFLMGILINRIFDTQGIMNGDRDERVLATIKLHGETVDRCVPYMDQLESWCEYKNEEALKRSRKYYLSARAIRYDAFFDADGMPKPLTVPKQLHFFARLGYKYCYWKAVHLPVTQISPGVLIGDSGKIEDPFYMGRSKAEYMKTTTKQDVWTKLATAIVFGYYGVSLIQNFDWSTLVWTVLQVVIFIAMGVIKMQRSYIYVTDEYRGRIIKKIDILQLFELDATKQIAIKEEAKDDTREKKQEPCQEPQSGN